MEHDELWRRQPLLYSSESADKEFMITAVVREIIPYIEFAY